MNNKEKSPTDAILNPLNDLVDEKESEILDLKNSFLDDDVIAENVILSKEIADDLDSHKFQLLYIADEVYYLIHHAENGETNIVNKYNADEKPSDLTESTNLFKFIASDVDKIINKNIPTTSTNELISKIVSDMLESIVEFIESPYKSELKEL